MKKNKGIPCNNNNVNIRIPCKNAGRTMEEGVFIRLGENAWRMATFLTLV
jgi:hypothetical protein